MLDVDLLSILTETLSGLSFSAIFEDSNPSFRGGRAPSFRGVDLPGLQETYNAACETLRRNPTNIQALFERGVVCRNIGWYPEAVADFAKVIRLQPKHAQAWLFYSEVLANVGEYEKSGKARKTALALDPDLK